MSYAELYLNNSTLVQASAHEDPVASIFGVPFDSTHSYRPGCRFGPNAIRESFNNIEIFHPGLGVDLETASIEDLGDTRHTVMPEEMIHMVRNLAQELVRKDRPLIILGGEHSLTYGAYTGLPDGTGYVVFDAHYDLRDGYAGSKLSHASYLRRIAEERGSEDIIHVGARAFVREELEFLQENKIRTIPDRQAGTINGRNVLRDFASGFDSIYVSIDMDVLDPAFGPGVGNPEAAGMTSRELLDMIYELKDSMIACADIVELNPQFDNGSTAAMAAKIMSAIIAMGMART